MPNSWTTPTYGVAGRELHTCFKIELDFSTNATTNELRLWEVMPRVLAILGDHKLDIDSLAEERTLINNPRPWRAQTYSCNLSSTLASLSERQLWLDLQPAFDGLCNIAVYRGTRELRHCVWWLEYQPQLGPHAPRFELALCTAHIPKSKCNELGQLTNDLFAIGADISSCQGGRAGMIEWRPPKTRSDKLSAHEVPCPDCYLPPLGVRLLHDEYLWQTRPIDKPLVHYLAQGNLFSPPQVDKLGGVAKLRRAATDLVASPDHQAFSVSELRNGFATVWFREPDEWSIDHGISDYSAVLNRSGYHWLAREIAVAGMFAFQDERWVRTALRQARQDRQALSARNAAERQASGRSRFHTKSKAQRREELEYFWSNPPRCIRDVAVVADPIEERDTHEGLHCSTTHFWIRPNNNEEAFTIYGRPSGEKHLLSSPVHVGAIRPERAVFTFDEHTDGWDGETRERERLLKRSPVRLRQLVCPDCKGRMFTAKAVFEHPLDDELRDDEASWSHREDFFTWFRLIANCATCPWHAIVADIECA